MGGRRTDERIRLSLAEAREALAWSAALRVITPEALALMKRLAEHIARFSPREDRAAIRRQLRAAAEGWRPRCPICGGDDMRPLEDSPGDFTCPACGGYCGQAPERDLTPFQAWLAQIRWARQCMKPGASSGSSGRRRRRHSGSRATVYADDED